MQWSGLIGIGIATIVFTCCISGIAVILRWCRYQRELVAIQSHVYHSSVGYQRLCHTTERTSHLIMLAALLIGTASAFLTSFYLLPTTLPAHPFPIAGLLFCIFIAPNLVIPCLLYDLLGIFWVDAPALMIFHGSAIEPKQALLLGLKSSVVGPLHNERRFKIGPSPSLLSLLLLEMLGLLYYFRLPPLLWLIPLLAVYGNLCYYTTGGRHIIDWTTHTTPIEQSRWAALVHHIDEWARLAGIKFQDIRIQTTIRVGNSTGMVCGIFRPILLIDNTFLAHSDWRQQEALLAWMIRLAHKRFSAPYLWLRSSLSVTAWIFLAAVVALLISFSTEQSSLSGLVALAIIIIIVYGIVAFIAHHHMKRAYFEADVFAAHLTKDPLALIIALYTTHSLITSTPRLPTITQQRINALYQLAQQPGHWTRDPVPSLFPFSFAEDTLTTPLQQLEDSISTSVSEPASIIDFHGYKTYKQRKDGKSFDERHSFDESSGPEYT